MNKASIIILLCLLALCACSSPTSTLPPTAVPSPLPTATLTAPPPPTLTPSPQPSPTRTATPQPTATLKPSPAPSPTSALTAAILFTADVSKEGKTLSTALVTADGKAIAAQTTDGLVYIWEVASGASWKVELPGSEAAVVFGTNGAAYLLAATSITNSEAITLWVITPGQTEPAQVNIAPNAGFVTSLAFSNDGKILAAGFSTGQIHFYDGVSGELVRALPEAHSDWVMLLAFSPDGRYLLSDSMSFDPRTLIFDVQTGKKMATLAEDSFNYMPGFFSPDGSLVSLLTPEGTAVFDTTSWKRVGTLPNFMPFVVPLKGKLTIPESVVVETYQLDDGRKVATYFFTLVFPPDGRCLILENFPNSGVVMLTDAAALP